MTRVLVVGDERKRVEALLEARGHEVVRRAPELVLTHGGDGSLLRAERWFPDVPKMPVRVATGQRLCARHTLEGVLRRLADGALPSEELDLLELRVGAARLFALNDVVLRNDNPAVAVRFHLVVDGVRSREHTGDGLVIATPFGSTAYYRSVTRTSFGSGIGVGFNNATRPTAPLQLDPRSSLVVEVVRGPAVLVADNDDRAIPLREGHWFGVRRSERTAQVLGLDALRCQDCRRADHGTFNPH
ncbi:MAG: NAD(+)/NADH kinase [Planctomycetes bacterium]|nr:NAD(+)/NADH kinase [Planctomycetota bacterium]